MILQLNQENLLIKAFFLDSINSLYSDDSLKRVIFLEILDSLKILSDNERNKRPYHKYIKGHNGLNLALSKDVF